MIRGYAGLIWVGALALSAALSGCGPDHDQYARGSEVTNPPGKQTIAGLVRNTQGTPAPGVSVRAYPLGYDPVADSAARVRPEWFDVTGKDGAYLLDSLDTTGTFNVYAADSHDGTKLLLRDIKPDTMKSPVHHDGDLTAYGALAILIYDSLPHNPGDAYVYLEGTPLSNDLRSLSSEAGVVILDSVPSGYTTRLFHKVRGALGARTLLGENILVPPGDTVPVGIYGLWKHSRRIFLNTTPTGADIGGPVKDFPLAIRLDSGNFNFQEAGEDGADLRFARKDGVALPFEIESWDKEKSKAMVWVKVDSINGNDKRQFIRMYWGKTDAVPLAKANNVFNGANSAGIWHFESLGTGSPPEIKDASPAGNTAYAGDYPTGSALVESLLGKGMSLNGSQSELYTKNAYDSPGYLTLSLWFRTKTDSGGLLLGMNRVQATADTTHERDRQIWMDDSGKVRFGVLEHLEPTGYQQHVLATSKAYNDGNWHYAVGMISTGGMSFYMDGARVGLDTTTTSGQPYVGYWRMGFTYKFYDWPGPPAKYYLGELDEVRVMLQPFTDDWLKLNYESQRLGGTLLRFE